VPITDELPEWVEFDVLIPLNSKELDAEARSYLAKLDESIPGRMW